MSSVDLPLALTFDDVLIRPGLSSVHPNQVDLRTELVRGIALNIPIVSAAMDTATLAPPYDLVSLLIGVNNQYRGRPLAEYRTGFRALLRRAIALACDRPGRVIVVSIPDWGVTPFAAGRDRHASSLRQRMVHVEELERVRVAINDMKGGIKSLYNYTSNLTPFFFFLIGGYLVVQGRLSLGALVAALAAYKEIAPALRELFDFAQDWSDAAARFAEVTRAVELPAGVRPGLARSVSTREAA